MSYDRESIAAYVDGELDLVSAKRIEKAMADDGTLAAAVEAERNLRSLLAGHYAPVLDETLPDRLTTLLSGNVDSSLGERRAARWYQPSVMQWGAMAASLVVGLMIGGTALNRDAGYVRDNGGQMVASGALADALDTQLASTQGSDATVRIGTSFASADGTYCRTFESASLDGIACNSGGDWRLRRTMSVGDGTSEYRQASAGEIAEAAAAMIKGEPLDAADEKAAAANGWR